VIQCFGEAIFYSILLCKYTTTIYIYIYTEVFKARSSLRLTEIARSQDISGTREVHRRKQLIIYIELLGNGFLISIVRP
jgi:hypothetical protein